LPVSPKAEGVQGGVGSSRRSFSKGGTCLAAASAKADLSRQSFSEGGTCLAEGGGDVLFILIHALFVLKKE